MPLVETDLESSNISGHAEPCLVKMAVINLEAYVIKALLNEKNLKRLVHFLHNYFTSFVNTYFKRVHNFFHKLAVALVIIVVIGILG